MQSCSRLDVVCVVSDGYKWKSLICALSLGVVLMHAVNSACERGLEQRATKRRANEVTYLIAF
jgi:hypothetical protein